MNFTKNEVLQYVSENDVKFIRLTFFDIFGRMKNISIMASELPGAFDRGILFDASSVKGFMNVEESDLLLFPDPTTLSVLPWRPQQGRVVRFYCNIKHPDGRAFEGDGRYILRKAMETAKQEGYTVQIGSECEFYLFEADEKGNPTRIPHDFGEYCDVAPVDRGENVRREICLTLEEMGIQPEASHHESGNGQNEVDFKYSSALDAADNLQTFKTVVKSIASRYGLFASFMPLPLKNDVGSGLHINFSLLENGVNIFKSRQDGHSQVAESFIAGILKRVREITLFLNPLTNSYARFGKGEAPQYITWSHQNRSQLIRIPAATGELSRMELRSPDPACNPYIAFSLLIYAGLEGVREREMLPEPTDINLYSADKDVVSKFEQLPEDIMEAAKLAEKSGFVEMLLNPKIVKTYVEEKQKEYSEMSASGDREKYETEKYFRIY
ncbi:MAG: glutamine synthetase family protein [Oscillospiraceae bacterium]|jgi:glutamine synthetase